MSRYTDGDFTTPAQHGAKQVMLPLQQEGDAYCTEISRAYKALAEYYDPLMRERDAWTNELLWSDDASADEWVKTNATGTAESATDTEGDTQASKVAEDGATGAHGIQQAMTIATGAMQYGALLKQAERSYVRLRLNNATDGDIAGGVFDLSAGTVTPATAYISKLFGGWYWCRVAGSASTANSSAILELSSNGSTFSYAGATGYGAYVHRQTVVQSAATPFPAMLTTAATRAVTAPLVDKDDPLAFLVEETAANPGGLEFAVAEWNRSYARVSIGTEPPSSVIVAKPEPPISGTQGESGNIYFEKPDDTVDRWDIYRSVDVLADSVSTAGVSTYAPSAGTWSLSFLDVASTPLAYSATSGDVQDALNVIAPVASRGPVGVAGDYVNGFTVTFPSISAMTIDTTSLTGTNVYASIGSVALGSHQFATIGFNISGGTWTVTILGDTTSALNYNATLTELSAAINALASVIDIGGFTVTTVGNAPLIQFGIISFSIQTSYPLFVADGQLLQPPPGYISVASGGFGNFIQRISLAGGDAIRTLYAPSHGASNDGVIFLRYGTGTAVTYYSGITSYNVIDSDNIEVSPVTGVVWNTADTVTKLGPRRLHSYQAGPLNIRCQKVSKFYLPGFTAGVATENEIPVPPSQSDPTSFFNAVIDPDNDTINWDVGSLEVWRGPILRQTTIQVLRDDLVP